MSVYRVMKNRNYTTMSNYHLRDKNLSLKAIGLLSIFLSLPDDWKFSVRGTAAIIKDGKASVERAMKELKAAGYLETKQMRDGKGKLGQMMYIIYETPRQMQTSDDYEAVDYYVPEEGSEKPDSGMTESGVETGRLYPDDLNTGHCDDVLPHTAYRDTENRRTDSPHPENRDTENRDTDSPHPENRDTENRDTGNPHPENRDAAFRDTENPYPDSRAQINTNKTIKEIQNTDKTKYREREAASRYGRYRNVLLTDRELDSLRSEYPEDCEDMIENLSEYMHLHNRSYSDHLATMLAWARKDRMRARTASRVQKPQYDRSMYRVPEGESL